MKIIITETFIKNIYEGDRYTLEIMRGKERLAGDKFRPMNECPEDAYLHRDLNFVYNIIDYFKLGYEAGQQGLEIEYIEKNITEEE